MIPQEDIAVTDIVMYGCEAWIARTEILTDYQDMNTLWDSAVPKNQAGVQVLDPNDAVVTESFFQQGEVALAQILGQEVLGPERIFQKESMLSFANAATGFKDATPDTYLPAEAFKLNVGKKYTVRDFNGLMVGIGSPDYVVADDNDIIPVLGSVGTRQAFYALQFLQEYMDMAMISLLGLTEAGAESPYVDILTFLEELLERVNIGGGGSSRFEPTAWTGAMYATAGILVPGMLSHSTLGPDAQA